MKQKHGKPETVDVDSTNMNQSNETKGPYNRIYHISAAKIISDRAEKEIGGEEGEGDYGFQDWRWGDGFTFDFFLIPTWMRERSWINQKKKKYIFHTIFENKLQRE